MAKLNPIERSKYINDRYKEYLKSSFEFGKGKLQKLFIDQLEQEKLFKGPYIDMSFPFKRGHNLDYLIEHNEVCKLFRELDDINYIRPLYAHQERAIKQIKKGRSAVITTGTGSGKTEAFLYPILNELLYDIENGNNEVGVRALFLYPMNALVNDQIDRVRKILSNYPQITFGFFTGDTPEKANANDRNKLAQENGVSIPNHELISREEIRNNPPHLLFTNYSMLEFLLIRPNDYSIFTPQRLANWKFIVLDEAHSYNGALGIELSLLLRRLTGLAAKKPRFILTSATLGEQGKSEKDIVRFASNLTSVEFNESDIIFSEKIELKNCVEYRIQGSDYTALKNVADSYVKLQEVAQKYYNGQTLNVKELLYELLIRDENVYKLSSLLKKGSKEFAYIYSQMSDFMSQEELVALIDLINMSEKDGIALFDLKYHSFVRPLSGAYITYGKEPKLSLTKTNEIDGMKAFEVGNCRYCNSPYIIGKIQHKEDDKKTYLLQNNEIDIYENYGNEEFSRIDYFLLENSINEEEVDIDNISPYEVCSKCGEIHMADNLNAKKCECGEEYRFKVYKVLSGNQADDDFIYNNITQCPCCGHRGKSGVVKALNIGKDEGTALIAQMLYEAIDEREEEDNKTKEIKKLSLKPRERIVSEKKEEKAKQYLSFSDSRQQASFAAVFFDANHIRMLRKRLVWEIIKNNNYEDLSLNKLIAYLDEKIKAKNLFQNDMDSYKNAWATVLVDLLKIDGSYDGEGLGLYYFDLNVKSILNELDEEEIAEYFGYNMTKQKLYTLMQVVFSVFKTTPAINYVKSTLTPDEKREVLDYRRFNNYVILNNPKKKNNSNTGDKPSNDTRSFLPVTGESNMIVRYVMKVFGIEACKAKDMLESVFNLLLDANGIETFLHKHDKKDAYQIDASKYIVKNYKTSKFYQCQKCGRLTPYNINDKCVQDLCDGKLLEVDPDEVLASNFYRQQYKNKKIESIVIKEHTAQLSRKKAKEYQIDFKNKKINILSCSTTFEMGIDIGGLETVFMRNVPPTPANYVQRAGRAGRRKDSSAYILTYCGVNSHDYTFFSSPEKMISGVIQPPFFNVLNRKIIVRHLMATSLGFFFRKNSDCFKNLGTLVINGGVDRFKEYMNSQPADLNEYINNKILPEAVYAGYRDFKWLDDMGGEDEKMKRFVDIILEMKNEFELAKEDAIIRQNQGDAQASREVAYYINQLINIEKESVIDSLSRYCVIPKYGFPVDLVELQIYDNGIPVNKYDMSRDLKIAISEYAPDSEVICDGKKYTSKYIALNKHGEYPKNWFVTCPICKKINVFLSNVNDSECCYCGASISTEKAEYYIEPVNGFKTGQTKESTRLKPKKSYAGEVSYIGNGKTDEEKLIIGNLIELETSSDDELLVLNKAGFYMCPLCGYSDISKGVARYPKIKKKHKNYKQFDCHCDEVEYIRLGHKFRTDVARITVPSLSSNEKISYPQALSFLYAFLEGVSKALEIERDDIDGVLTLNLECQSYDIILYDNVPGGAGHVKRLLNRDAIINSLKVALAKVSVECCNENTSCYNCLKNYRNQSYHKKLQRKLAINVIKRLLFEIESINM